MNTELILHACMGLVFVKEKPAEQREKGTWSRKQVTDKAWKQLLREEAFLRA